MFKAKSQPSIFSGTFICSLACIAVFVQKVLRISGTGQLSKERKIAPRAFFLHFRNLQKIDHNRADMALKTKMHTK